MAEPAAWDRLDDEVVRLTSELIRIDTTNAADGECRERPAAEYLAERLDEAGLEPRLLESAPGRANVVARVPGRGPDRPALLVHGHTDVVPADPTQWSRAPFSGEVDDGWIWGRGAVDMKDTLATVTALVRMWARLGVAPARDLVLAFTADEEASAAYGAQWLAREHRDLFADCTEAIGESGGHTVHARRTDGAAVRLYPVGVGERGSAWLRLRAEGPAGHGSRPGAHNAVLALTEAVARLGRHRWPVRLTAATRASLTEICAALGVTPAWDADGGLLEEEAERVLAELGDAARLLRPVLRNSTTPTMLQAGYKLNVIPSNADAGVDGRIVPGGAEEFEAELDRLTGGEVAWRYAHHSPAVESPADAPILDTMRAAVTAHDPDGVVVPVCLSGGTDAKHFAELGIAGYGFTPMRLPAGLDYASLAHGVDERVSVQALRSGARMLDTFLREPSAA